jgi:hypothetical protein
MNKSQNTGRKLPWHRGTIPGQAGYVFDCNGTAVFQTIDADQIDFIVSAVNSHDELLQALKNVCYELNKDGPRPMARILEARAIAVDALAKVNQP